MAFLFLLLVYVSFMVITEDTFDILAKGMLKKSSEFQVYQVCRWPKVRIPGDAQVCCS